MTDSFFFMNAPFSFSCLSERAMVRRKEFFASILLYQKKPVLSSTFLAGFSLILGKIFHILDVLFLTELLLNFYRSTLLHIPMHTRPHTTLFLIASLDGKISSGDTDALDVDADWKRVHGVKEGLSQYYALEKQTDACFFQSGRVFAKIGFNWREPAPLRIPVTGVIVDNKPHLMSKGIRYLSSWLERVLIVTTNPQHPAFEFGENVHVIRFSETIDFSALLHSLRQDFGIDRLTIQSGGTLNATLLRLGLIDEVSFVIAPLLVGGANTPTLVDGEALHSVDQLTSLRPLELLSCERLDHSYLHLRYRVLPKTVIDDPS
jgi:2,5-diamino-6-(ribosylamino)-4(3H)-pyrimidinone 5'-phosphate reductase